jgi:hypothetical protein
MGETRTLQEQGFGPDHVVRYMTEWAEDQREREAWNDKDRSTYRFRALTLEAALAALRAKDEEIARLSQLVVNLTTELEEL